MIYASKYYIHFRVIHRKEIFTFFRKCVQVTATGSPNRLMETEKLGLVCAAQFYSENGSPKNGDKENKWKTCIWRRNLDGAMCTIEYMDEYNFDKTQCDSSLGDVRIIGGKRSVCEIEIPEVTCRDLGNWTCTMEECKDRSMGGCKHKDSGNCKGESTVYVAVSSIWIAYLFLIISDMLNATAIICVSLCL